MTRKERDGWKPDELPLRKLKNNPLLKRMRAAATQTGDGQRTAGLGAQSYAGDFGIRVEFWQVARQVCPSAFWDLRKSILPLWHDLPETSGARILSALDGPDQAFEAKFGRAAGFSKRRRIRARLDIVDAEEDADSGPEFADATDVITFAEAIRSWSDRYRIGASWVVGFALETLQEWSLEPAAASTPYDSLPGDLLAVRPEGPPIELLREDLSAFAFEMRAFDPAFERRSEYKKAAVGAFRRALDAHLREIESRARIEGLKSPQRFTPKHLEWTARWRLLKESPSEIARTDDATTSVDQVRTAVRRMAARLSLPKLAENKVSGGQKQAR